MSYYPLSYHGRKNGSIWALLVYHMLSPLKGDRRVSPCMMKFPLLLWGKSWSDYIFLTLHRYQKRSLNVRFSPREMFFEQKIFVLALLITCPDLLLKSSKHSMMASIGFTKTSAINNRSSANVRWEICGPLLWKLKGFHCFQFIATVIRWDDSSMHNTYIECDIGW